MTMGKDIKKELLHLAHEKSVEKFKTLLNSNSRDTLIPWNDIYNCKSGDTVMHIAARNGCIDILRYLKEQMEFGYVNFEQANLDGKTSLHESAQSGQEECTKFLLELKVKIDPLKRADWTPLMLACTKANLKIIEILIEAGANVKLHNKDGWNAFHIACREGHQDILHYLLDRDPDLWNTVSNNGRTPLHTVALHGHIKALEVLMERCKFKADEKDSCGTTPTMDAARADYPSIINFLIEKQKVDVTKEDILGRNSLHLSAQAGSLKSINYLIDICGINVNTRSSDGQTSLHFAAKEKQVDAIKLLILLGADVNIQDCKGRKAYDIAVAVRCEDSKLLLHNG